MSRARIAGVFYLVCFVAGTFALVSSRGRMASNVIATVAYIAVTLLFYDIFKPVNRTLSLIAAVISIAGLANGALVMSRVIPPYIQTLAFFGVYCLLIGYLILRSTFLPRSLGALMALGGVGWLTFASPALASSLQPYNFAPGMFGEGVLTVWLLAKGVNERRWHEQARGLAV